MATTWREWSNILNTKLWKLTLTRTSDPNRPTRRGIIWKLALTDTPYTVRPGMLTRPGVSRPRPKASRPRPEVSRPRPRPRPEIKAKVELNSYGAMVVPMTLVYQCTVSVIIPWYTVFGRISVTLTLALALNEAKARNTRPKASRPRPEVSRPRPENLAWRPRPNNPVSDPRDGQ